MTNGAPRMVFLGFGKFARADKIYALEPLRAKREDTAPDAGLGRGRRRADHRVPHRAHDRGRDGRRLRAPLAAARRPGRRPRRAARPADRQRAASTSATSSRRAPAAACWRRRPARRGRPALPSGLDLRGRSRPSRPGFLARLARSPSTCARSARRPAFRRLWFGTGISAIGSQITTVAIPIQVYEETGSTFLVGLLGIAALVPLLTVSVVAGAVADAVDRRRLLLVSDLALAAVTVGLLLNSLGGDANVPLLFVFEAAATAAYAFQRPGPERAHAEARAGRPAARGDRGRGRRLQPRARRRPRASRAC